MSISGSYLPDYLGPENRNLVPPLTEKDYNSRLWSVFGQYNQKIGNVDLWVGLRNDAHDEYSNRLSYNVGAVWSPEPPWMMKLLYGVAYRTPFARQLLEEARPDPEEIETVNLQVAWKPSPQAALSVCGFVSRIDKHIMEDPYAGLSLPNKQNIKGVEIEGRYSPVKSLDLSANLTLLDNDGPSETYHWNDFSFVRPDGTVVKHFTDLTYPYDRGPGALFNLMGTWRPVERLTAFLRLGYFSSRNLIFPRSAEILSVPGVWLLDMSYDRPRYRRPRPGSGGFRQEPAGQGLRDARDLQPHQGRSGDGVGGAAKAVVRSRCLTAVQSLPQYFEVPPNIEAERINSSVDC